jgi:pyruvate dehydrogenase E1 component
MRYTVLGTDGYGRSDTRENLRRHFEVSRYYVAQAAVAALAAEGKMDPSTAKKAKDLYGVDGERRNPAHV